MLSVEPRRARQQRGEDSGTREVHEVVLVDGPGGGPDPGDVTGRDARVEESTLRSSLGIPAAAERVLVLTESTHWDPNWLLTSEEYFRFNVGKVLDKALDELAADPRRIYSLECGFFPRLYWERRPERREQFRALVNEGRIRFTGSGVTTPDTLLPRTEALLRDLLLGQEWLRSNGMTAEPRSLYLPDSFGHAPTLPAVLAAAGVDYTSVTRIDGMFFPGAEWESASQYPRPGSSAARLLADERSIDFVWRAPSGEEVLAHWNAFTYGHADLLAAKGATRWMGLPLAVTDRSDDGVAGRLSGYIDDLAAVSRTPYLLGAIGFDFIPPIPALGELIDRWNDRHYPRTGTWVVNAGLDDYLDLVATHRRELPVIELDPNPYWTGFYSSRPSLKQRSRALVDDLVAAEAAAVLTGAADGAPAPRAAKAADELADAWWVAATANHHDFITGTSPDRVYRKEQVRWLAGAERTVAEVLARSSLEPARLDATTSGGFVTIAERYGRFEIDTGSLRAEIDTGTGTLLRVVTADGRPVVEGASNELVAHADGGGLWRMGMEYRGGRFGPIDRTGGRPADVSVERHADGLVEVAVHTLVDGVPSVRQLWFVAGCGWIRFRTRVAAGDRRTVTARFRPYGEVDSLVMEQPGGLVERPLERHYRPTYWPMHRSAVLEPVGIAFAAATPTACSVRGDGRTVDLVVARNALKERAWGVVPLLGMPAKGRERAEVVSDYVLVTPPPAPAETETAHPPVPSDVTNRCAEALEHVLADRDGIVRLGDQAAARRRAALGALRVDDPSVEVIACKAASRGDGVIVRLERIAGGGPTVRLRVDGFEPSTAVRCDARERDLDALAVDDGAVIVPLRGAITSVRLLGR